MRPWNSKEVAWLKANYRELGQKGCARHLQRSIGSVRHGVRQAKLHRPRSTNPSWAKLNAHGKKLLSWGFSGKDVASELEVSHSIVLRWAKRRKLKLKIGGKRPNMARIARATVLLAQNYTVPQIAGIIGCEPSSLYRSLKKYRKQLGA